MRMVVVNFNFFHVSHTTPDRRWGHGVGEEPNHTTARKPVPLLIILYPLVATLQTAFTLNFFTLILTCPYLHGQTQFITTNLYKI